MTHTHDWRVLDVCRDYCDMRGCQRVKRVCPPRHQHDAVPGFRRLNREPSR